MNIKKLALPLVILVGALSLAACNDDSADQSQSSTQSSSQMQSSDSSASDAASTDNSATDSDSATSEGSASTENTQGDAANAAAPKTNNNGDTVVNSSN